MIKRQLSKKFLNIPYMDEGYEVNRFINIDHIVSIESWKEKIKDGEECPITKIVLTTGEIIKVEYFDILDLCDDDKVQESNFESFKDMPIQALFVSDRSTNALRRAGIQTIGQALSLSKDQLTKIDGIGVTIANEITNALRYYRDSEEDNAI